MCLDLVPELSLWACCSDVRGDVLGGLGAVGGLSERSTKIRKIRHIGCLLLPAFFRWCAFWSNCFCNLQFRSSLGG